MTDKPISELTPAPDAIDQIYQQALKAFTEWRSSFETHKTEESRYAEAYTRHQENPGTQMPDEYEGIESPGDLAQINANRRGYLEGRFEGICQALSMVAGGNPMEWNVRIHEETMAK